MNKNEVKKFQNTILSFYKKEGRFDLPWRKNQDFYSVLVSEIMLQQTQVERVAPKFVLWMELFPNFKKLAEADLGKVLTVWQGLGYQRRAKALHSIATILQNKTEEELASMRVEELVRLPGVGPYTARAIRTFVYGEEHIFIETNIRTVFTHYFFKEESVVSDRELLPLIEQTLYKQNTALWYAALMDYGSHLKKSGVMINNKSKSYTKQTTFRGSKRELRAKILFSIRDKAQSKKSLLKKYTDTRVETILLDLEKEGFIYQNKGLFQIL